MKIAIMQPYIFPYIGYWQLISAVDKFIILDDVNFMMRGFINRNYILMNEKPHLFTIPLNKPSQNKLIKETELKFYEEDKKKFLKKIEHCYSKAPNYIEAYSIVEKCVMYNGEDITEFIMHSINVICDSLDIKTEIMRSSQIDKNNNLKAQEKIIEVCRLMKADVYINPQGGRELYQSSRFEEQSIKLFFLDTQYAEIQYKQFNHEFVDKLSIIDILMFNNANEQKEFLKKYELNVN